MTVKAVLLDPQNQVARELGHKAKHGSLGKTTPHNFTYVLSKALEESIAEALGRKFSLRSTSDKGSFGDFITKHRPDVVCFALSAKALAEPTADMWLALTRGQGELPALFLLQSKRVRHGQLSSFIRKIIARDPSSTMDFIVGDFASKNFWGEVGLRTVRVLERAKLERAVTSGTGVDVLRRQSFKHLVPELHNPDSGRIDASLVANHFAIPLSHLAKMVGVKVSTVHKTPDALALQNKLGVLERIAALLREVTTSLDGSRSWLNAPNPELENEAPLNVMKEGHIDVVLHLLEDVFVGHPR